MADISFTSIQSSVSTIASSITDGILSIFGLGESEKSYPSDIKAGMPSRNYTNEPNFRDGSWQKPRQYGFVVVKVKDEIITEEPASGWKEFRLQINPQELTQDEIFAIEVTPTFRGVLVEHHGAVLKDITMSGTTGSSPNRREGGAVKATGKPVLRSGRSGYEEFHDLRSYVRIYVESKRVEDPSGGEHRLIFKNFKDNEFLFVEPQKFTMKRTVAKRTLYDYVIQLKGIGVANGAKADGDSHGDLLGDIIDVINTTSDLLTFAAQVIDGGVGLIRRFERDVTNTILGPLRAINDVLDSIKSGEAQLLSDGGITKRFLESFKNEAERVEANFNDGIGRDMTQYNTVVGRTSTLSGPAGRVSTDQELQILNAFGKAKRGVAILLSENSLFAANITETNAEIVGIFSQKITLPTPNSVRTVRILGGDNIQILAARELNDPDRFREIVILNNLKPPYIDEVGGDAVKQPGDEILVPQPTQTTGTGVKKGKEYNITAILTEAEKGLGTDIRLNNNNDLAISNIKDLDLITGMDNMSQSLLVRLGLEPGSLKRHKQIGTGLLIGNKTTTERITNLRENILSSYAQDLRIQEIPFVETSQEGGTTFINMIIKMKNVAQPVPLPIEVKNTA